MPQHPPVPATNSGRPMPDPLNVFVGLREAAEAERRNGHFSSFGAGEECNETELTRRERVRVRERERVCVRERERE